LILLLLLVGSCTNHSARYIYENGVIQVGGDGKPIELIDNPDATNPTYAELVAFIKEDSTNELTYIVVEGNGTAGPIRTYICSDFAETVHNNAEEAGIRAAWVSIYFDGVDEGHALNAFETTDRGLVYVDCTGIDIKGLIAGQKPCDKIAYV